jgi:hypothetical protein
LRTSEEYKVLKGFKDGLRPHTATDPVTLPALLAVIAELKDTTLVPNCNMRSCTNFKDDSPAHYRGDPQYGDAFTDQLHCIFTLPIAKLTCMGHMGMLDILGQWPSYGLITSERPLSLLVAFIPAFLQPICNIRDENKQYIMRNECLDTLQHSWDYTWAQAEEIEQSSNFLIPAFVRDVQYQIDTPNQPQFENLFKPWYCSDALHACYLQIT